MKQLDTSSLRKSVTFSIVMTMLILIIVIITTTDLINKYSHEEHEQKHTLQVRKSIEQVINHYVKEYKYIAKRIIKTTYLIELLQKKDREKIYKIFKPKWDLMREEEPFLSAMHFHLSDGSSFLRMHKPEIFGDNLTSIRPMTKEISHSHKLVSGYETGKNGLLYRIITPIFDSNQTYIGALELGLSLNFIIHELSEINNVNGLVFVKDEKLTLFKRSSNLIIDGYKLLSKPTGELKAISKALTTLDFKENDITFQVADKKYQLHIFTLNDFQGQPKIKILIFHDAMRAWTFESFLLTIQLIFILISLILLVLFVYRRIGNYEKHISLLREEQIRHIEDSEKKFHSIFDNSNDGILIADVENRKFLTGNRAISKMLDYAIGEIENMNIMDIHPPKDIKYVVEQFEKQKKKEIIIAKDIPVKRKDNSVFYADINSSPIILNGKKYLIETFRDVTKKKQLQHDLELNQNYLQAIFDITPNIMIVYDGQKITRANGAMLNFTGFSSIDSFKEKHSCICDFFVEDVNSLMPIMQGHSWLDYILSKPTLIHEVSMMHYGKKHRFIVQAKPLNLNKIHRSVVTFTDVTEIEVIKEQLDHNNKILLEHEEKLRAITDSALDAIIMLDNKGRLIFWNPKAKEMLGYDEEELMGSDFHKIVIPKAFQEEAEKAYKKFALSGEGNVLGQILELSAIKKGGIEFPISLILSGVQIDGEWHSIGFMRDITERNKLQNELKEKDEIMLAQSRQAAMGDMISMIAHQWRQPITAIGMGAQNMQLDIELGDINPKRFDTKLTKIVEQTEFLSKTIDDFRDFLKPNKKPKNCKLSELVEDSLTIIGKSLQNNNITLEKSFEGDIKITTYYSEVIQVLLNIINNSKDIILIKNVEDGIIWISFSHDEKMAYIKICDNAGGIPENILPRIFEPYFTTKEEKGGTGLGLYMSQMIIEKHLKGTIKAQNHNGGACITVSLPLKSNNRE